MNSNAIANLHRLVDELGGETPREISRASLDRRGHVVDEIIRHCHALHREIVEDRMVLDKIEPQRVRPS